MRPIPYILILLIISLCYPLFSNTAIFEESEKIIEYNKPAIIQITVHYSAYFTSHYPEFTFMDGMFIFNPTTELSVERVESCWNGTGFLISPDGYAITNAHVSNGEYYKKFSYLFERTHEIADYFLAEEIITFAEYDLFFQSYYSFLNEYGNFTDENIQIISYWSNTPFLTHEVIAGDPIGIRTSKDIAVVNLETQHTFPAIKLGNSDKVSKGDSVCVLGYPMDANRKQILNISGPSVAYGIIDEIDNMNNWKVFRTDAPIMEGYSGGPAFNSEGAVIGLAAFGTISPITNTVANFLIPINIVKEFLERSQIQSSQSVIDQYYQKALELYWKRDYDSAIIELDKILDLNPFHLYAEHYRRIILDQEGVKNTISSVSTEVIITEQENRIERFVTLTVVRERILTITATRTLMQTVFQSRIANGDSLLVLVLVICVVIISTALVLLYRWAKKI